MDVTNLAQSNFETHIRQNTYPGRGLIIGRGGQEVVEGGQGQARPLRDGGPLRDEETWLMVYWIMGRSASSRNRHFVVSESGRGQAPSLRTEPVDVSHMEHPELLIYEAMLELPGLYLVSNGDQTRTIYDTLRAGGMFDAALAMREREPDAPHYTPRISGMLDLRQDVPEVTLSILKANKVDPAYTDRTIYHLTVPWMGLGVGLTTYAGDGNPLPSFTGDPLLLPLSSTAEDVLETYWNALNADNRISLAVKEISSRQASRILVRNRFSV
jgi:IMP cyclohydrolase